MTDHRPLSFNNCFERHRNGPADTVPYGIGFAVLEIPRQGPLARIQIQHANAEALFLDTHGQVHRRGGFSGPTLLVTQNNDVNAPRLDDPHSLLPMVDVIVSAQT